MTETELKRDLNRLVIWGREQGACHRATNDRSVKAAAEITIVVDRILAHFAATEAPVWVGVTAAWAHNDGMTPTMHFTGVDTLGRAFSWYRNEMRNQLPAPPPVAGDGEGE